MKTKIEIKSWLNKSILFEFEKEGNTIKETLEEAINKSVNLRGADLQRANLWGIDLRDADLRDSDLREAELWRANLWRADLRNVKLQGANLWRADLRDADLEDADLRDADLRGADLRRAKFWNANLQDADLRDANLWRADLRNVKLQNNTFWRVNGLDIWWHVHHETLYEQLTEPIRNRINYIKAEKPKKEVETRLKLLKPVLGEFPKDDKGWESLHKKECKGCPWNGKTIFSER